MNKKDDALRMAAKAFLALHHGGKMEPHEFKLFADLCSLALPMKYRFTRTELDEIRNRVTRYDSTKGK